MDKINLISNGQSISFTTKSLTINDEEYLYSGIQAIKHSSTRHLYLFKYEDAWHNLYYNDDDQKKVAAIFTRIAAMNARKAQADKTASDTASAADAGGGQAAAADAGGKQAKAANAGKAQSKSTNTGGIQAKQVKAGENTAEAVESINQATAAETTNGQAEANAPETTDGQAGAAAAGESDSTADTDADKADNGENTEEKSADLTDDEKSLEKKARLRKSIIVFIIIIALFVAAGVAYFFILGPANDSSQGTSTDTTHEYDDIEELIDEMQE